VFECLSQMEQAMNETDPIRRNLMIGAAAAGIAAAG
jgi:hypothetical protein